MGCAGADLLAVGLAALPIPSMHIAVPFVSRVRISRAFWELGEALATASGGTVTAEAEKVSSSRGRLPIEPNDVRLNSISYRGEMRDGHMDLAVTACRRSLDKSPADAPWRSKMKQGPSPGFAIPQPFSSQGPTADDVDTAVQEGPEDRRTDDRRHKFNVSMKVFARMAGMSKVEAPSTAHLPILNRRDTALDALNRE